MSSPSAGWNSSPPVEIEPLLPCGAGPDQRAGSALHYPNGYRQQGNDMCGEVMMPAFCLTVSAWVGFPPPPGAAAEENWEISAQ